MQSKTQGSSLTYVTLEKIKNMYVERKNCITNLLIWNQYFRNTETAWTLVFTYLELQNICYPLFLRSPSSATSVLTQGWDKKSTCCKKWFVKLWSGGFNPTVEPQFSIRYNMHASKKGRGLENRLTTVRWKTRVSLAPLVFHLLSPHAELLFLLISAAILHTVPTPCLLLYSDNCKVEGSDGSWWARNQFPYYFLHFFWVKVWHFFLERVYFAK